MFNDASIKISRLILEASQYDERYSDGIHVNAIFDPGALKKIWGLLKKVGFKNFLPINKAHATIVSSTRPPNKEFKKTPINGRAEPSHFEVFGGQRGKPYILVLVLKSRELHRKHSEYTKKYNLKSGGNYTPHITIVYDIKRLLPGMKLTNPKAREQTTNMFNLLIKDMPKQISIIKETVTELSSNWQ